MKKILIANRGEIALRVMRTAREMNIATVAIYSDADRDAPFVRFADQSVYVGAAPSSESYLRMDAVIEACLKTGADALHPGYGFLSENAVFARKLREQGITLIGPSPEAMEVMGSKLAAKAAVKAYGIPLVPGTEGAVNNPDEALKVAREIGFPVLIKASAGGGGKGMRVVTVEDELETQMRRAISEAESSFGDGAVFVERYVDKPRHIEVQVLADTHGNVVHLFERECSIQRRHQKVIEEAPSSILTAELRQAMGKSACDVARACQYVGAGTVEFLVDASLNFYFLEMNTRLQVEHPVTEMITGVDLVREQIRIAQGHPLSFTQDELRIQGHALELRVYAEDPQNDFLPDIGTLQTYRRPEGAGIRVDDGYEAGMSIPIYYDPMIAKLVVHAADRQSAIERMTRAIDDYHITGVKTTLPFGRFAINHEAFKSGDFDTGFVNRYFRPEFLDASDPEAMKLAAAAALVFLQHPADEAAENDEPLVSQWRMRRR
jgi:acetyl-CoA carboxylase biotin carboxylase subunit